MKNVIAGILFALVASPSMAVDVELQSQSIPVVTDCSAATYSGDISTNEGKTCAKVVVKRIRDLLSASMLCAKKSIPQDTCITHSKEMQDLKPVYAHILEQMPASQQTKAALDMDYEFFHENGWPE